MLTLSDLDLFTVHLAVHLLGADAIRRHADLGTEFQLYWRSPLLLRNTGKKDGKPSPVDAKATSEATATATSQPRALSPAANGANRNRVLFVDVTFDFACGFDDERDNLDALIRFKLGSLWEEKDATVYYSGKLVSGSDLEVHFLEATIDEASTPAPILAKCLAAALQQLSSVAPDEESEQHLSKRIKLYYQDVDCFAALNVSEGAVANEVPRELLQMMILQQQRHQEAEARLTDDVNTTSRLPVDIAEMDTLCALVMNQWKPNVQKAILARSEEKAKLLKHDIPASAPPEEKAMAVVEAAAVTTTTSNVHDDVTAEPKSKTVAKAVPVVKKVVVRKKGASHGFAKINPKKPKKGGLQFAD